MDTPAGQKVRGRDMRDALDGTSNSILVGETIYQNMQINRGWGSSHRTKHGVQQRPGQHHGHVSGDQLGQGDLYDAFSDMTTDQNIHNHLMNTCFGSLHPGGAQFCMGDGSVRFLNENLSLAIYRTLGAINDGLPRGGPRNSTHGAALPRTVSQSCIRWSALRLSVRCVSAAGCGGTASIVTAFRER